jgi:hypothetical protein
MNTLMQLSGNPGGIASWGSRGGIEHALNNSLCIHLRRAITHTSGEPDRCDFALRGSDGYTAETLYDLPDISRGSAGDHLALCFGTAWACIGDLGIALN